MLNILQNSSQGKKSGPNENSTPVGNQWQWHSRCRTLGEGVRDTNTEKLLKSSGIQHSLTRHFCYFVPLKPQMFHLKLLRGRIHYVPMMTSEWHQTLPQCSLLWKVYGGLYLLQSVKSELREQTSLTIYSANISWHLFSSLLCYGHLDLKINYISSLPLSSYVLLNNCLPWIMAAQWLTLSMI